MRDSTEPTEALDVRSWVPIDRHTHLRRRFNELPVGQGFVLLNDHDPLPLCYELRSVPGDVVGWEYLERGGTDWKVKVTRTEASRGREFIDISTLVGVPPVRPRGVEGAGRPGGLKPVPPPSRP